MKLTDDGRIVSERDWRRNTLSSERSRQEREEENRRAKQREQELKNNKYYLGLRLVLMMIYRIEILQKIRQDELDRKKVEERRRLERGLRDSVPRVKREEMVEQVMIAMIVMSDDVNVVSVFLKSEREKSRTRVLFGSGVSVA